MTRAAAPSLLRAPERFFLAAVLALGVAFGIATTASATTSPAAQNVVGASTVAVATLVGPVADVSPAMSRDSYDSQAIAASATGVADDTGSIQIGRTARSGASPVSQVTANKIAGDAFRDQVAGRLESEMGFSIIGTEVRVKTPFGPRIIDILAEKNGGLVNFETKLGSSRYLTAQRAKDWWIANVGVDVLGNGTATAFPSVVIRGPLP